MRARCAILCASLVVLVGACNPGDDLASSRATDEIRAGERDWFNRSVGILRMKNKSYCTGTLIAPDVVLTAAHCVVETKPMIAFYLGPGKRLEDYESTEAIDAMAKYDVIAQAPYPGFTPANEVGACPFAPLDVGLVKLSAPVGDVTPEPLDYRVPALGETCSSVGFGVHGDVFDWWHEKRWASERMRETAETAFAFDPISGSTEIGDSGAPIFCSGKLVAVNSCMSNPDWAARLDAAQPWLTAMLERWDPGAAAALVRR